MNYYELKKHLLAKDAKMIREEWFKDHKAELISGEPTYNIRWANLGSWCYGLNILMHGRYITFTGDLGSSVFDLTWQATPYLTPTTDLSYILGKLDCCSIKYNWNGELAKAYLINSLSGERINEDTFNKLESYCDYRDNWNVEIRSAWEDSDLDTELASELTTSGDILNPQVHSYIIAWQMAVAQLNTK